LANSGFIPYDTPAAIPAAIPIAVLLSLFIAGAKILLLLPKCPTSTPLTTSGARRLTGPMSVGHYGETIIYTLLLAIRCYLIIFAPKRV
jgi:hypothetical protein